MADEVTPKGSGSLKERQRQERVELILEAAEKTLLEKGYHEMAMEEIASEVGIAKATIYLHFPSKEELFIALLKRSLASSMEELVKIVDQPLSVRVRLELILREAYCSKNKKRSQLFLASFTSTNYHKEVVEKHLKLQDSMRQTSDYLAALLEEGQKNGEIDATIPSNLLLTTFLNFLSQAGHADLRGQNQLPPEEYSGLLARLFFHGVGKGL
ncbi:MAG: TetR/AcrR family transcriptional regulator [Chloroflexota bacterium]|nr:TetR/AcrR family transcriptional regulator [Chloroflexota bacterium]